MGRTVSSALLQNRCHLEDQATWKKDSDRTGERGGARIYHAWRIRAGTQVFPESADMIIVNMPINVCHNLIALFFSAA
jgi:hypothetical protein